MQIQITGQQIDLGSSLRSYIESALEGTISKYFEDAVKADVRIFKERNETVAEITVHPVSGVIVRATGASGDPYAAFDVATNKVARQLRRYKNKMTDYQAEPVEMVAAAVIESDEEKEVVGDAPVIVAEMQAELPVCTVSAAVMKMDLEGLPALMFRNTAHGGLNMVYRRNDGNIGWVDPKNK